MATKKRQTIEDAMDVLQEAHDAMEEADCDGASTDVVFIAPDGTRFQLDTLDYDDPTEDEPIELVRVSLRRVAQERGTDQLGRVRSRPNVKKLRGGL